MTPTRVGAANRRVVVDIIREKTVVSRELSVSQDTDQAQTPTTGLRPGEQWPEKPVDGQNGAASSAPVRQADGILAPADRALLVAPHCAGAHTTRQSAQAPAFSG